MKLRNDDWIQDLMYVLWDGSFADVPRKNFVYAHFGRKAKRQLGCIRWVHKKSNVLSKLNHYKDEIEVQDDDRISQITISGYLRDPIIPTLIPKMVLAHEMVHYAHGFNSPLKKQFQYPHQGNIVNKELEKRNLLNELQESEKWLEENWVKYLSKTKL